MNIASNRTVVGMVVMGMLIGGQALAQSKCTALKYKFAGKAASLTAKCKFKAAKKGEAVDPDCLAKVQAFLTKKWPKAEDKGDCLSVDDQATVQGDIDDFITALITVLGTPTALGCGNNTLDAGEECDGTDDDACPGVCLVDCTCPFQLCGDLVREGTEECDTDDAQNCPGDCLPDCTCGAPCPATGGDSTACAGYLTNQACIDCCNLSGDCLLPCLSATAFPACQDPNLNDACSAGINALGCAVECCSP